MNAVHQLLTDHIDIWTAAETEKKSGRGHASGNVGSVYGIKKLRELILELAVQGKLAPQDANDEPASELLKRIQAEKRVLIADGKIRKDKSLPPIADEEKSFNLPMGWEWVRIGQIGHDWGQKTPDSDFTYIEVSAIDSQRGIISSPELVKPENAPSRARKVVKQGTVIYSTIRPYLRNIAVIEEDFLPEAIASTAFAIVHPFCLMPPRYFLCFFRSPVFVRYVESVQMGIAYPAINDGQFFSGLMPLPPIEEQHRIVAKVDELMALCDQLEAQHINAADVHEKLVSHLLDTLTQSQSAEDFSTNWQRIAEHFDVLFITEASIDFLKQTLLQLAVIGKLVPQDLRDESVVQIKKRIIKKRKLLVSEGKIKDKSMFIDFNGLDELKRDIPESWAWLRLGEISEIVRGGSPRPAGDLRFYEGSIPFLKVGDITRSKGKMVDGHTATIKEAGLTKTRFINRRTVLLTNSGATLGVPAICDFETTFNDGIAAFIYLSDDIFDEYLHLYLKSISSWFLDVAAQGQGQPNLNTDIIKSTWIPIMSHSEQCRIVTKVDELTALCEQLKTRIKNSQDTQRALAETLINDVVGNSHKSAILKNIEVKAMKISTTLILAANQNLNGNAVLAELIEMDGGQADAKNIWIKSKLDLPNFYKQLKFEIEAGFILKPAEAKFDT